MELAGGTLNWRRSGRKSKGRKLVDFSELIVWFSNSNVNEKIGNSMFPQEKTDKLLLRIAFVAVAG